MHENAGRMPAFHRMAIFKADEGGDVKRRRCLVCLGIGVLVMLASLVRVTVVQATAFQSPNHDGGTSWHIECVDCPKKFANMTDRHLRLDSAGYPHIAYGADHLYYAWYDGTKWHYETVDAASRVGAHAALALDAMDFPHISYYDRNNNDLKYAYRDGTMWHIETVDSTGLGGGGYTSLALDEAGYPHISYYDSTLEDLKYAHWTGSTWEIQTVDRMDWNGHVSLALDTASHPHISYFDEDNYDLKYAQWTGSTWDIQTVDSEGVVGCHNSMALDATGHPHISYSDERTILLSTPDGRVTPGIFRLWTAMDG